MVPRGNFDRQTTATLTAAILCLLPALSTAADAVDYLRDVRPILEVRCFACHGALKQESGLRLDTANRILQGSDAGLVIQPGSTDDSRLFARITAHDELERMPPEGRPLSPDEIQLIRAWIMAGAPAPSEEISDEVPLEHWAFRAPLRVPLPDNSHAAASNPIDLLLDEAHREHGLQAVGRAERSLLLRRVYLDLIGLPPTHEQLDAFLADNDAGAWLRIVDALLDDPHHGERWGRHWMDVWRYSDWYGLDKQLRHSQKHIWRWRDWIVESLNEDTGYDQMVMQMLAGDELAPTEPDTLRATGFLARNYYLFNRTTWLDATIEHTSQAFLGLTLQCAKCHDHKYDPISQLDYYRMRAIFEPHQVRLDTVPGVTDLEQDGIPRAFDAHLDAPTYLHIAGNEKQPETGRMIEPGVPAVLSANGRGNLEIAAVALPLEAHRPELRGFVLRDHLADAARAIQAAQDHVEQRRQRVHAAAAGAAANAAGGDGSGGPSNTAERNLGDAAHEVLEADLELAERTLEAAQFKPAALRAADKADRAKLSVRANAEQQISAAALAWRRWELAEARVKLVAAQRKLLDNDESSTGRDQAAREVERARRSVERAQQALESPGTRYTSLPASLKALEGPDETDESRRSVYPSQSSGRRTSLARWITNRNNPLAARVAVNHIWMRHMGQPLVDPVTDFGRRTAEPALRELLDWLAIELMDHGWSMKHIHRLIVTSEAYRRSTSTLVADEATLDSDAENRFYWYRRPVRMESEVIRDSLLHLAGQLDPRIGGPTLDPSDPNSRRRSLYFTRSRDHQHPLLAMFDDADILRCYRRQESILPQQALALANSRLSLEMARRIAEHVSSAAGERQSFVTVAFETVLARPPLDEELGECLRMLERWQTVNRGRPDAAERARASLIHVLLNHNDFVTIR